MFSWFERATMTVILINCITLGMYQPCEDTSICDQKCKMLKVCNDSSYLKPISRCFYYCWWFINAYICNESFQIIDDVIYVYFVAEMLIKMVSIKDAFFLLNSLSFITVADCAWCGWKRLLFARNLEQVGLLHCGLWVRYMQLFITLAYGLYKILQCSGKILIPALLWSGSVLFLKKEFPLNIKSNGL